MKVARNKTRLQLSYHPASPTFGQSVTLDVGDLPDVTRLTAPVTKLQALAERVCDELDDYSRWVGRHGDLECLAALALLPAELADTRGGRGETFFAWIDEQLGDAGFAVIQTGQLLSHWSSDPPGNLTKRDATRLGGLLERHGVGIEPDIRFTGINLSKTEKLVAFRLPNRDTIEPSDAYRTTTALLHLGAAVVAADGRVLSEEERRLEQYVENAAQFSATERARLRAHIRWLLETSPGFAGLKQRCGALDVEQRQQIGRFLIGVTGADGHLAPEELTILGKIYRLLGLNPDDVFREVHALAVGNGGPATEPVLIAPADHAAPTYRIPHPKQGPPTDPVTLAPERVAAIMAEIHAVATILGAVFTDNDSDPSEPEQKEPDDPENQSIAGLDVPHSSLVRHLAKQPSWHRYEFDELTNRLGLMPAGAIETINEIAFEIGGAPLVVNPENETRGKVNFSEV